jgi:hypothetical protein
VRAVSTSLGTSVDHILPRSSSQHPHGTVRPSFYNIFGDLCRAQSRATVYIVPGYLGSRAGEPPCPTDTDRLCEYPMVCESLRIAGPEMTADSSSEIQKCRIEENFKQRNAERVRRESRKTCTCRPSICCQGLIVPISVWQDDLVGVGGASAACVSEWCHTF